MKKFLILVLIVILVLIGFIYYRNLNNRNVLVGGDKDSNGCLASAGYIFCQSKNKCLRVFEEFCSDNLSLLVGEIRTATNIEMEKIGEEKFVWNIMEDNKFSTTTIDGFKYSNSDLTRVDYEKIENYMKSNFEEDLANMADGFSGGQRSYIGRYMACLLNFRHNKIKETTNAPSEPVGDSLKVDISCGFYNKNTISQ